MRREEPMPDQVKKTHHALFAKLTQGENGQAEVEKSVFKPQITSYGFVFLLKTYEKSKDPKNSTNILRKECQLL